MPMTSSLEDVAIAAYVQKVANAHCAPPYPIVLCLIGQSGIGKTMHIETLIKAMGERLFPMAFGARECTEWEGLPYKTTDADGNDTVKYIHPADYPPMDFVGPATAWCDELDRVTSPEAANLAGRFMNTGEIGTYRMPSHVRRICAMNGSTDTNTFMLPEFALQRMCLLYVKSTPQEFAIFAAAAGYTPSEIEFFTQNWDKLQADPDFEDHAAGYGCYSRCYDFVIRGVKRACERISRESPELPVWRVFPMMAQGYLGLANTALMLAWDEHSSEVPSLSEIKMDPCGCRVPDDPALQLTIAHNVASNVNGDADSLARYVVRMRRDVAEYAFRQMTVEHPEVQTTGAYCDWVNAA